MILSLVLILFKLDVLTSAYTRVVVLMIWLYLTKYVIQRTSKTEEGYQIDYFKVHCDIY